MTPEYYKFPSGVQVIEISRYLTSNAGQALGYIARSSRLDGNNKFESPVDCLRKARDLIDDEIKRLTPDPNSFRGFDGATYFWEELDKRIKDAPEPYQFQDEYHLKPERLLSEEEADEFDACVDSVGVNEIISYAFERVRDLIYKPREPRQWNTLADVPGDVMRVTDRDGYPYRRTDSGWEHRPSIDEGSEWGVADKEFGTLYPPYAEVIE